MSPYLRSMCGCRLVRMLLSHQALSGPGGVRLAHGGDKETCRCVVPRSPATHEWQKLALEPTLLIRAGADWAG